jgi:uncharacterized protein
MAELIASTRQRARAPFHVLVKPIGPLCNLDCEYCFYLDKTEMYPGSKFKMSDATLETHIREYIENQPQQCQEVNFAWQGGEPTLMGLDFFKRVAELQQKYRRPGMRIDNALQTNGTKLDAAWSKFLKANNFLVGISLDGPKELHDRYRKTKGGRGSFDQVKRGLDALLDEGAEFNVLTVVQRHNGDHPIKVFDGLKALGATHIQFIPSVERVGESGVSARSVLPDQFGKFLITIFERWRKGDIGRIFVQHFDTALNATMGNQDTLCVHARQCGRSVALEHNGDVYSCDHYVNPSHLIGNVNQQRYVDIIDSAVQTSFGEAKQKELASRCLKCKVLHLCNGGCPVHQFTPVRESQHDLNYLCAGYKAFFSHIEPYMQAMAAALRQRLPASEYFRFLPDSKMKVGRNEPCPCGSGRKYKLCCAR